jgi:hypothetical protein
MHSGKGSTIRKPGVKESSDMALMAAVNPPPSTCAVVPNVGPAQVLEQFEYENAKDCQS